MKLLTNVSLKVSVLTILLSLTCLNLLSLAFNLFDFGEHEYWVLLPAALLSIGFFAVGYWLLQHLLFNPIKEMGQKAKAMAYGDYDQSIAYAYNNEFSIFSNALNHLFEKFRNTSLFVKELRDGNIAYEWAEAQTNALYKDDTFIQSLLDTRNSLRSNEQSNYERNWATEGIAKLEDVLRQHSSDLAELSNVVITFLIKYLKANQGAVFLLKEEEQEQVLALTACYAYGRKKYLEKHIKPGQGLVGQAVLEKEKIYLTDIPQNYTQITSGLGEATPTALIVLPLKVEEKVVGVIEIASFNTFETFEQEFLEKACQSIASSVMNANTNIKTSRLLKQSQQQTEELRAQEEEMRQNLEEMEATQEEMRRISAELEGQKEKLSHAMTIAKMANWEIDLQKEEFHVNDNFFQLLDTTANEEGGYSVKVGQIVSKYFYVDAENVQKAIGAVVAKADPEHEESLVHKAITNSGKEIYLQVTLKGLLNDEGEVTRLYGVCRDVTGEVNLEKERDAQLEEMQAQEEELRQNLEEMEATQEEMRRIGNELEGEKEKLSHAMTIAKMTNWEIDLKAEEFHVNDNFFQLLETTAEEEGGYQVKIAQIVSKYFYVDAGKVQQAIGQVVAKADPEHEELLVHKALSKSGKEIYLSVVLKGLLNDKGQVSGLYGVCRDVTNEVKLEEERDAQLEEMQAQEEELRQNLEEMEAVQEDMSRVGRELEAQQSKLSHALRIAKMANWEIDLKSDTFHVNDNFFELLETTAEEEGGYAVKVAQIVSKYFYVDAENVQKAIGAVIAKADPNHEELLVHKALSKSGRKIYLSVVLKALLSGSNEVVGLYGVCQDVTKEKPVK